MPIFLIFALVLATLKLAHVIALSWLVIALVVLIPTAVTIVLMLLFGGVMLVAARSRFARF